MTGPRVIAHRGCSGERPEHTRAAYERAIAQGADFIEPDLVMSRDGALIVRHENEIGETTDIATRPEFADRKTRRQIDGRWVEGWFTEDFTLAELKTLRARERLPHLRPASAAFDGTEEILTFEEVAAIAAEASARTGRIIGVAPELKHPGHFAAQGLDIETAFVDSARHLGLADAPERMLVQCFEVGTLQRLSSQIKAPLLQLMDNDGGPADRPDLSYSQMATPEGLAAVSKYATMIGVNATMIVPRDEAEHTLPATALVRDAHARSLDVVVWTMRAENHFLPKDFRIGDDPAVHGDLDAYLRLFYDLGIDAVFSDFPAAAVQARQPPR